MIVQPDFLRHWKTRKFIAMTGDPAAPLALIRLWGHCQTSRRYSFPGLKRDDLAAICEWDSLKQPKLSCEKALLDCGWITRLKGGGYLVEGWANWNKNLICNWLRNPSGKPKDDSEGHPTGAPRAPGRLPDELDESDQTNSNQMNQTNPTNPTSGASPAASLSFEQLRHSIEGIASGKDGLDPNVKASVLDGGTDGRNAVEDLASSIAKKLTPRCGVPTLAEVRAYLHCAFAGADAYAESFYRAMEKSHWKDKNGQPINDWKAMAKRYASTCHLKRNK